MNPETEEITVLYRSARLNRFRERLTTWFTFGLLIAFFVVTIALWGYAAWWCVAKLISLLF